MATATIASPPPLPPTATFSSSVSLTRCRRPSLRFSSHLISSRLHSKSNNNPNPNPNIIHHAPNGSFSSSLNPNFVPVFVTLPEDAVSAKKGAVARRRTMEVALAALAAAGVEGVTVELWWGVVERQAPTVYDWEGYLELVRMAERCGLKVRAVMGFHCHCGDMLWIPLPWWVLEEMDKEPDLAYSDRLGRRSKEYLSLGCDTLPLLKGRSPIQAYSDFMRSFRDTFQDFLGVTVTEIQVGMGPAGELRYPSSPSEKLKQVGSAPGLGEFQCYDKSMLASLGACARKIGMDHWGNGGPLDASSLLNDPEQTSFFKSDGSWNTSYGELFLEWYSRMLLAHGERLCSVTQAIFLDTGAKISAKVAGIHWHYYACSHPSELTAGYYNTPIRDGYLPIARMFGKYKMTLCCPCFEMRDTEEVSRNSKSSPQGYLRQLINAARICNVPLSGENSVTRLDDASLRQVIYNSRFYSNGAYPSSSLSFNFVRMNKNLFEPQNWNRFTRFVRQMSDVRTFHARLYSRTESCVSGISSVSEEFGRAFA